MTELVGSTEYDLEKCRAFVELAHPHNWMLVAENLHDQVLTLRASRGQQVLTYTDFRIGLAISWDETDRASYLLMALAMENATKAFLVFENPTWVSNGKLGKHLKSHSLTSLRAKCRSIPYKNKYKRTVQFLEAGIESWARYPCGKSATDMALQQSVSDYHWNKYCLLMKAYGRRMRKLLHKGWNGPHQSKGHLDISGDFFQFKTN